MMLSGSCLLWMVEQKLSYRRTPQLVEQLAGFNGLDWDIAYIGLNDLMVASGVYLFGMPSLMEQLRAFAVVCMVESMVLGGPQFWVAESLLLIF